MLPPRAYLDTSRVKPGELPTPCPEEPGLQPTELTGGCRFTADQRQVVDESEPVGPSNEAFQNKSSQLILNALPSQIVILDMNGGILAVNDAWRRFAEENEGQTECLPGNNFIVAWSNGPAYCRSAVDGIRSLLNGECSVFSYDYTCPGPGRKAWYRMTVTSLAGRRGAVVSQCDITEHFYETETRSWLFRQELSAREQERRRIAGELHDGICQTLTAMLLGLQVVERSSGWNEARSASRTGASPVGGGFGGCS